MRILVCDDIAGPCLKMVLEAQGHEVLAVSGAEAVKDGFVYPTTAYGPAAWESTSKYFAKNPIDINWPQVVLMDGHLDGLWNGPALMEQMQFQGPVVAISNSLSLRQAMQALGACVLPEGIAKGEIVELLVKDLSNILRLHQARNSD